jgi:hypothetical protein
MNAMRLVLSPLLIKLGSSGRATGSFNSAI